MAANKSQPNKNTAPRVEDVSWQAQKSAMTRDRILGDSRCTLTDESAEYLEDLHPAGSVHAVISSLPFAIMDEALQESILRQIHLVLKPGGQYLQYQYAPTKYRMITRRFQRVRLDYTLLNIPPAFVYSCTK